MQTYHVVLYLHILSLLVGFPAGVVATLCLFRLRAATTLEEAAPWGKLVGQVEKAFPIAIVGLFATGAYMTSHLWNWSTPWIVTGIVGLAILALQGPLVAGKRGHEVKKALMANGPGPLGERASRMTRDPALWAADFANEGLVLAVVWNMTQKPGWAGAIAAIAIGYLAGVAASTRFTRAPALEAEAISEPAA